MVYLLNNARDFADEYAVGLARAYPDHLRKVSGGVVAAHPSRGAVAVITGGGTGHHPAFGGLVGEGLMAGAALGDIFASPSAQRIESVVAELDTARGVLFTFGNYAGDVLNFRRAAEGLRARGIEVEVVPVTDDIASAPRDDCDRRRGIAGGLVVYKVAGAAAAAGHPLGAVAGFARRANVRTRTLGVAFGGCVLPGGDEPLFTVDKGRMAVGMGIHGEPGIADDELPTADALASLLVDRLLAEEVKGSRVVVLLNGLGSVSYEELYVLYGGVATRLNEAGLDIVDAEVGEFVTSFDMAGVSLTLFWPDDELEALWLAPVDAAEFRRSGESIRASVPSSDPVATAPAKAPPSSGLLPSETTHDPRTARQALTALEAIREAIVADIVLLGRLDAVAGDGDHGIGMERGASAAVAAAEHAVEGGADVVQTLRAAASAWSDRAGGTSGMLWGIALDAVADAFATTPGCERALATGAMSAATRIADFGGAQRGDKTLLDAMLPFAEMLDARLSAGDPLAEAFAVARLAASDSAAATAELMPRAGRARPLALRSVGHPDPGAISFALAMNAMAARLWPQTPGMEES